MTGEEFIAVARQLLAAGSEAHFRTAVGRAYDLAHRGFVRKADVPIHVERAAEVAAALQLANADGVGTRMRDYAIRVNLPIITP